MKTPTAQFQSKYLPMVQEFVADRRDVRYYLNGFLIEPNLKKHGGGVILVATDGCRLLAIHDAEGEANQKQIVKVPKGMVRSSKKGCKVDDGFLFPGRFAIEGDYCQLLDKANNTVIDEFVVEQVDGKYPDWRRVFPKDVPPACAGAATFNPEYIGSFKKLVSKPHLSSVSIRRYGGDADPFVVFVHALPEAVGLVMPMALSRRHPIQIPTWIAGTPKKSGGKGKK